MQLSRVTCLLLTGILCFHGAVLNYAYGDSQTTTGDAARGVTLWKNNCTRCHNYRSPTEYSPRSWHVIMQHMRIQAGLTGQEAKDILAFLTQSATPHQPTLPEETKTPAVNTKMKTTTGSTPLSTQGHTGGTAKQSQQQTSSTLQLKSGKTVYLQTCVSCHGANGKGTIPAAPDFTKKNGPLNQSDSVLLEHAMNGYQSPGSPMAMPPKGGNASLTKEDLSNAILYIRQTFGK